MKKIITAMDNPKIYKELKNNKNIKIIGKDLIYKEAILEILEKNKNIDLIILYEKILGEINFIELIKKTQNINKKIKLIIILENKNEKLENNLKKINIKNIYLKSKINSKKIIEIINEKNKLNNLNKINIKKNNDKKIEEKENNKKMILKNNILKILNKIENKKFKIINVLDYMYRSLQCKKKLFKKQKESKHNKKRQNKTIIILENRKNPKKQLSLQLAEKLLKENNRTAVINFTNNTIDKKRYKDNSRKQELIEKELKKYEEELSKINLFKILNKKNKNIKNLKIKNNKEKNKIKYIENKNKIKNNINKKIKKIKFKKIKNEIIKKYNLKINKKYNKKNNYNLKNKKIQKNKNEKNKIINNLKNILLKTTENKLIYFLDLNLILKNRKFRKLKTYEQKINIIIEIIKNTQKEFDFLIIKLEEIENKKLKEKIIENANKIILFIDANYLGIETLYNFLNKNKFNKNIDKESLHILINKKKRNSINYKIIKQILKKYKISYIKKY